MLEEMDDREVLDVTWEVSQDLLEDPNNYPLPQDVPAGEWHQMFNWTGFDADTPPIASALSLEQHPTEPHAELAAPINHQQQSVLQSGPEFSQAEPYNQTQFNNVPTAMHTRHLEVRLSPVGLFKGKVIYGAPGDRVPSPVNVHNSKKRKRESQQDDEMPYIKKPRNAFMLSRKEQRPYVLARHKSTDSATVNTIIGKKDLYQQSVLQSGPEFSQAGPSNQTQGDR
ncbi:transcription factor 7-like [Hippoglossus hippoglossus]|uniref:transcription factor 7-like n=1 Tax=Hippoglossus hippoglossus TaxID=8267 RepID=UPI00148DA1B2|nr:transcription factor 7-like [Hippoglossus hippoglossus]